MPAPLRATIFTALVLGIALTPDKTKAEPKPRAATLMSRGTAPYQRALAGFLASWDGEVLRHDLELEEDALQRIRAERPQVMIAIGAGAARAAQSLGDIPVVYCVVSDPEGQGIGGSHVIGVPVEIPAAVQLEQLRALLPQVRKVGMVHNPARTAAEFADARTAAEAYGMELVAEEARSAAEFPDALQKLLGRVQALWLIADSTVVTQDTFRLMLEAALARKLPLMVFSEEFVRLGALFALSPDFEGSGAEAARLAKEVVAGTAPVRPAEARWRLVYNPGTAQALGLELPKAALEGARSLP